MTCSEQLLVAQYRQEVKVEVESWTIGAYLGSSLVGGFVRISDMSSGRLS